MAFELDVFKSKKIEPEFMDWLVDERSFEIRKHFSKLWEYYNNKLYDTNGMSPSGRKVSEQGRTYMQAQEYGLPSRITGVAHSIEGGVAGARAVKDIARKEVVIENDIAWRINSSMDFLFGKPITFVSKSPDAGKSEKIEQILKALFSANGDIGFLQDMAVLGGVYGFVDCFVRPGEKIINRFHSSTPVPSFKDVLHLARDIELELIDAPRALPVLEENDYRNIDFYVQHFYQKKNSVCKKNTFLFKILSSRKYKSDSQYKRQGVEVTEITSPDVWQVYEDKQLVDEGVNPWGFIPVVHIQNMAQPFYYEGQSDVEPLIPLQDELNTRLSDRASRITFQSFKMYLGKNIEGFESKPVSPGRMWHTDDPDATIEEFGGDIEAPSEESHVAEIREAMDKVSGVTPLVAGVLKNKLGNLTSAVALRLTLMGMLSKTERKRFTYGQGLKQIAKTALAMLDKAGIYETSVEDREVDIIFPSPLPENMMEKLEEAKIKKELGVPDHQVLRELGYEMKEKE